MGRPGYTVTPVLNGGFSLRSQRLMRALVEHPDIRVSIPPPDLVAGDPLRMHWHNDVLLMTRNCRVCSAPPWRRRVCVFRPWTFAIEHAGAVHHGMDALSIFGHHSKLRKLTSVQPPTIRYTISHVEAGALYGELDLAEMLRRRCSGVAVIRSNLPTERRRMAYDWQMTGFTVAKAVSAVAGMTAEQSPT